MKKIFNNLIKYLRYFLKGKEIESTILTGKEIESTILTGLPEKTQEKIKRLTYTKRTD
jgi:hypothetical protein